MVELDGNGRGIRTGTVGSPKIGPVIAEPVSFIMWPGTVLGITACDRVDLVNDAVVTSRGGIQPTVKMDPVPRQSGCFSGYRIGGYNSPFTALLRKKLSNK